MVSLNDKTKERRRYPNKYRYLLVGSVIAGLLALCFNAIFTHPFIKTYNEYIRYRYLPEKVVRHFIEHPISDVSINVPSYYSCPDFRFPDLPEAVNIQFGGRLKEKEHIALNYNVNWTYGDYDTFKEDGYPPFALFIRLLLSDQNAIYVDGIKSYAELYYILSAVETNDLPFFVTQLLTDYCFKGELEHYREDSLIKVYYHQNNHFNFVHQDFIFNDRIRQLLTEPAQNITIEFILVGSNQYTWDFDEALHKISPYLERLNDLFNFNISVIHEPVENSNETESYIDNRFPIELTDLPGLAKIYRRTMDDGPNTIHLVMYPFNLANDKIMTKVVDSKEIYSSSENTFLEISHWGSLYFSHSPTQHPTYFSKQDLDDCMWSYLESIMDYLGFPNENMSPALRLDMWERILVVNYLTYFSDLLFIVENNLRRNSSKHLIKGEIIDSIVKALEKRQNVVDYLGEGKPNLALKVSQNMIETILTELSGLNIKEQFQEVFAEYTSQITKEFNDS